MAGLVGLAAGGLLGGILMGAFTKNDATLKAEYNVVNQHVSDIIQKAMQQTNQVGTINQRIVAPGGSLKCGSVTITNNSQSNFGALGTFDAKSSADITNYINNEIETSITNDENITTNFLSSLPSNVTQLQMLKNIQNIVRQTYSSENLNSMLQALQVNQLIDLTGRNIEATGACDISNISVANLLANNSLSVLTNALFRNSTTNKFIDTLSNRYVATARGIFAPLSDLLSMIRWIAIALLVVVGFIIIVGGIIKLVASSKGKTATSSGPNLQQLLLLDTLTKEEKKEPAK